MYPDAVFPVKICGKACLIGSVSGSMVRFGQFQTRIGRLSGRIDCFGSKNRFTENPLS